MAGLDRRVHLTIRAFGDFVDGRYVPGPITFDADLWAQVVDGGTVDVLVGQALTTTSRAVFTLRWDERIIGGDIRFMELTYDGRSWNVETVTDYTDRRRFIQLAAVAGFGS